MLFRIASTSLTALCVSIFFSSLQVALAGTGDKAASPPADGSRDGAALQKLVKTFEAA